MIILEFKGKSYKTKLQLAKNQHFIFFRFNINYKTALQVFMVNFVANKITVALAI